MKGNGGGELEQKEVKTMSTKINLKSGTYHQLPLVRLMMTRLIL